MQVQKFILLLVLFVLSSFMSFAKQHPNSISASSNDSISEFRNDYLTYEDPSITDSIIDYGKLFLRKPYRSGAAGSESFDCSGYTSFVYHKFGYNLGHSSGDQAKQFDSVERTALKAGDLVFFSGRRNSKRVGHVGIVVDATQEGKFNFIHASCDKGVTITSSDEPYYNRRFIKANRVIDGNQLFASTSRAREKVDFNYTSYLPPPAPAQNTKTKKVIPAKYYTVKRGETLSDIAEKNHLTVSELKRKNGLKNSRINPKQRLKIKEKEVYYISNPDFVAQKKSETASVSEPSAAVQTASIAEQTAPKTIETEVKNLTIRNHKVVSGESLYSIARMYNQTMDELMILNELTNSNIQGGQVLKVKAANEIAVKSKPIEKVEKAEPKVVAKVEVVKKNELTAEVGQKERTKEETKNSSFPKLDPRTRIINHKVHIGENLNTIARDFKVSVDELKAINNRTDTKLTIGEEIIILVSPVSAPTSVALQQNINKDLTSENSISTVDTKAEKEILTKQNTELKVIKKPYVQPAVVIEAAQSTYKAKRGDDLNLIAERHNMTVNELMEINNLTSTKVTIGQKFVVIVNKKVDVAKENTPNLDTDSKPAIHKVKKGDDLNIIAKKYKFTVKQLMEINNLTSAKIKIGQEIIINKANVVADEKGLSAKEVSTATTTRQVKKGESLFVIAKELNLTVDELKELNQLSDSKIHFGQKLIVPKSIQKSASKMEKIAKQKSLHHKVKKGESLYTIAKKYDCSFEDLKQLNKNLGSKLNVGDDVIIRE